MVLPINKKYQPAARTFFIIILLNPTNTFAYDLVVEDGPENGSGDETSHPDNVLFTGTTCIILYVCVLRIHYLRFEKTERCMKPAKDHR